MEREPVVSSNIASIGYDEATETLEVEFTSGGTYSYSSVPQSTYQAFLEASSKGAFFAANIRKVYTGTKTI